MKKLYSEPEIKRKYEESKRPLPGLEAKRRKRLVVQDKRTPAPATHDAINATVVERPKTNRDQKLILSALNKHFIFTCLPDDNKLALIPHMRLYSYQAHEYVFQQNQPGTHFFVVASGKLEVIVNKKRVNMLGPEDNFGELALIHDTSRTASVKTMERSMLWGLDRKTFRLGLNSINKQNYEENKAFIENVPVFSILTSSQKEALLSSLSDFQFRRGESIVKEGDTGDFFYLIKQGTVNCTREGLFVRDLSRGEFFGEQALLHNTVRTATILAKTDVKCLAIGREKLDFVFGDNFSQIVFRNTMRIALDRVELTKSLSKEKKEKMVDCFTVKKYQPGAVIAPAGEKTGLMVVIKGEAQHNNSLTSSIGDFSGNGLATDFIALTEAEVAEILEEDYNSCMIEMGESQETSESLDLLKQVQLLRGLPVNKLKQILQLLRLKEYADGECIVEQNTWGNCFYIIKNGKVNVVKDRVLRTITKLDFFGERSLLYNDMRTASVVANGKTTCWELHKEDFFELLDDRLRGILEERIKLQDDSIQLGDLAAIRLIGKGSFGNVYHVIHQTRKTQYALKCVNRDKIDYFDMHQNILLERTIMMELDHTLVVKLVKTFKDSKRLYFLMELVMGEELFDVLRILDVVSEEEAKFYTACIVLIIEHLHERKIVYRDLKPENLMIDHVGYPKLIDFGISKIVTGRTYTVVGTPHYMAPEMITGKGYAKEVDWYALGIMLYEFMYGNVPFGPELDDPYEIYEQALKHRLVFPSNVSCTRGLKDVIQQLVDVTPANRNRGELKNHAWFNGFIWENILTKEMPTPYTPKIPNLDVETRRALSISGRLSDVLARDEDKPKKMKRIKSVRSEWDRDF